MSSPALGEAASFDLTQLPRLVAAACARDPDVRVPRNFIDLVLGMQSPAFTGALLFLSRDYQPFVMVHGRGAPGGSIGLWRRWPFSRLFAICRAGLVDEPGGRARALAVPFRTAERHRFVVLLTLAADWESDDATRTLLETFGAMHFPVEAAEALEDRHYAWSLDAKRRQMPRMMWFGSHDSDLTRLVEQALGSRGWLAEPIPNLGELWQAVTKRTYDIIFIDADARDPSDALRSIRRLTSSDAAIIIFARDSTCAKFDLLAERCLGPSASVAEVLQAVNAVLRSAPARRREALRTVVGRFSLPMSDSPSCSDLVRTAALAAHQVGADWAAVHLFDEGGNVYHAQWPDEVLHPNHVPSSFLSGCVSVRYRVDSSFYEEVLDSEPARAALAALRPISAVSLPIEDAGRVVGTLLAVSTTRMLGEAHFDAFKSLTDATARAFAGVQTRLLRSRVPAYGDRHQWGGAGASAVRFDLFSGPSAKGAVRAVPIDGGAVIASACAATQSQSATTAQLLASELEEFAEVADASEEFALRAMLEQALAQVEGACACVLRETTFTYACAGTLPPLHISAAGPSAVLSTREGVSSGQILLEPRSTTLIVSGVDAVDPAALVRAARDQIALGSENPLLGIVDTFADPDTVAIAAITTPNFGAGR